MRNQTKEKKAKKNFQTATIRQKKKKNGIVGFL
jgi:hypothetical protein